MKTVLGIAVDPAGIRSATVAHTGEVDVRYLATPLTPPAGVADRVASVLNVTRRRLATSGETLAGVVVVCDDPQLSPLIEAATAAHGWSNLVFTTSAPALAALPAGQVFDDSVARGAAALAREPGTPQVVFTPPEQQTSPAPGSARLARGRRTAVIAAAALLVGVSAAGVWAVTSNSQEPISEPAAMSQPFAPAGQQQTTATRAAAPASTTPTSAAPTTSTLPSTTAAPTAQTTRAWTTSAAQPLPTWWSEPTSEPTPEQAPEAAQPQASTRVVPVAGGGLVTVPADPPHPWLATHPWWAQP